MSPIHLYLKWLPDVRRLHLSRLPLSLRSLPSNSTSLVPTVPPPSLTRPLFSTNKPNILCFAHGKRMHLFLSDRHPHYSYSYNPHIHIPYILPQYLRITVQIESQQIVPFLSVYHSYHQQHKIHAMPTCKPIWKWSLAICVQKTISLSHCHIGFCETGNSIYNTEMVTLSHL